MPVEDTGSIGIEPRDSTEFERRIERLLDKDEITELLNRYARCVDEKIWDDWAACFTEDAVVEFPFARHEGSTGLAGFGAAGLEQFESTHHISSNFEIEIEGNTASARSNVWAAVIPRRAEPGRHFDEGGVYDWKLRRTESGWRFSSLRLTVLWTIGEDETGLAG